MPLTGAIPEGPSFFCPHCGALYAVTYSRLSNIDSNVARCVVCGQIMDKWDSTKVPIFKLTHRPEDSANAVASSSSEMMWERRRISTAFRMTLAG